MQFLCPYGPIVLRGAGAARPYWIKAFTKKIREKKSVRKTARKPKQRTNKTLKLEREASKGITEN